MVGATFRPRNHPERQSSCENNSSEAAATARLNGGSARSSALQAIGALKSWLHFPSCVATFRQNGPKTVVEFAPALWMKPIQAEFENWDKSSLVRSAHDLVDIRGSQLGADHLKPDLSKALDLVRLAHLEKLNSYLSGEMHSHT